MLHILAIQFAVVSVGIIGYYLRREKKTNLPLPPGPRPLPIIGNYKDLPPPGALEFQHWLKFKEQYGPVISLTVFGQPMIILYDKEAIVELLDKQSLKTSNRPSQPFGNLMCGFGQFLPSLQYGDAFKKQRKIVHQQMGTKALASQFDEVQDVESARLLLRILKHPEDLREHIKTEASAIILKATYGYAVEPHGTDPLVSLVDYMMECLASTFVPLSWLPDIFPFLIHLPEGFPGAQSFQEVARRCKEVINAVVDAPYSLVKNQLSENSNRPSFVASLIQEYTKEDGTIDAEDELAIKRSAGIMYGAAADTTVTTISSMILAMLLYPETQRKAQKEIDAVLGVGVMPLLADRDRLPYVDALIKECWRWYSVVPIGTTHVATEELIYNNYRIPNGSYLLMMNDWLTHDPEVHPNPEAFEPERFLTPRNEPDPTTAVFGRGRRICPGRFMAEDSVFLTVSRILAVFNINKKKDALGREVKFEVDRTPGLISRLGEFPYEISPRSEKHAELIRSIETTHPWEKGDAPLLESRVHQLGEKLIHRG
ncbi:cytochrome P450 [Stachybotrys elegans]|uniref:Cytochrome P450 n=1 Tax=Stachybotrys elegans TaxID=80388 RepID=A0A8K0SCI8_9HYPO|nr:cytochrome P450 [Stachybotrys elegans]